MEGLLTSMIDGMSEGNPLFLGDSAVETKRAEYNEFMQTLKDMRDGKTCFTLDIVDPLANSWIYSEYAPNPDPRLEIVDYERSFEEDEALGLNDMVVDDEEIIRRNKEEAAAKLEAEARKIAEKTEEEEDAEKRAAVQKKKEEELQREAQKVVENAKEKREEHLKEMASSM